MSDTKSVENDYNETKCSICLDTIGDKNIFITNCNHTFCGTCMIKHSRMSKLCPLCRTELIDTKEDNLLPESSNPIVNHFGSMLPPDLYQLLSNPNMLDYGGESARVTTRLSTAPSDPVSVYDMEPSDNIFQDLFSPPNEPISSRTRSHTIRQPSSNVSTDDIFSTAQNALNRINVNSESRNLFGNIVSNLAGSMLNGDWRNFSNEFNCSIEQLNRVLNIDVARRE